MDSAMTSDRSAPILVYASLEGLEIDVPPPPASSALLNKPLPRTPGGTPSICSSDSTVDIGEYTEKPLDHDDLLALGRQESTFDDHSDTTSTRFYRRRKIAHRNSITPRTTERYSLGFKTFLTEEQYGVGMHLARANHYFREKKWDIFPELGPQAAGRESPSPTSTKPPRRRRPRLPKALSTQQLRQGEVFGINLRPAASHLHHTIVTKTSRLRLRMMPLEEEKHGEEEETARGTSPLSRNESSSSSSRDSGRTLVNNGFESVEASEYSSKSSLAAIRQRMREMSPRILTTRAELKEESISLWKTTSTAVLNIVSHADNKLTPSTMTRSRSCSCSQSAPAPRLRQHTSNASMDRSDTSSANETLPVVRVVPGKPILSIKPPESTERERGGVGGGVSVVSITHPASHHIRAKSKSRTKTTMVLVAAAYNGAKEKIADVHPTRKKAELKKQIRLVGPIDQYPDGSVNQWV